jgi:hypothetical protein
MDQVVLLDEPDPSVTAEMRQAEAAQFYAATGRTSQ